MSQHDAWASGRAADAYFLRNIDALTKPTDPNGSTRFLARHLDRGKKILEIGSANGRTLEQLRELSGCVCYGTDPSPTAIADGASRFPELNMSVGLADDLGFPDESFDAVLLGFCLYLVDRKRLFRVVAEVDRVLRTGGRLMITDFDVLTARSRAFKHQQDLSSFKTAYADLWLANPQYVLLAKYPFSHHGDEFHEDPEERVASWVLCKQHEMTAYPASR